MGQEVKLGIKLSYAHKILHSMAILTKIELKYYRHGWKIFDTCVYFKSDLNLKPNVDFRARLENFFLESETEFIALELQDPAEGGVAAEEDGHLAHLLLPDLGEDFVPVGAAGIGSGLEASHQISFFLE